MVKKKGVHIIMDKIERQRRPKQDETHMQKRK